MSNKKNKSSLVVLNNAGEQLYMNATNQLANSGFSSNWGIISKTISKLKLLPLFKKVGSKEEMLTVSELSKELGLSKVSIMNLIAKKKMPCLRQNRKYFFLRADIDKWLKNQ